MLRCHLRTLRVSPPEVSLLPSPTSSPSMPSSRGSARRLCPCCHRRMSSLALDKHTFCFKCRGADCDNQNRCDEYMSWSLEEMEAYVRLRKTLAGKSRSKKSSCSKPPSSLKTVAPVALSMSDVDGRTADQFESFSQSFDNRFEAFSNSIFDRFNELAQNMSDRLFNLSFVVEPGVPVCTPVHGQDPSLPSPDRTDGCYRQFQELEGDPVPQGSGYAQPSGSGECLDREPSLGPTAAQSQALPFGGSAPAQSRSLPHKQRVTFDDSAGPSVHLQGRRMTIMIPWFLLPL